jgi:hypothetical protein
MAKSVGLAGVSAHLEGGSGELFSPLGVTSHDGVTGEVTTCPTVLNAAESYSSNSIPLPTSSATSLSTSVDQKRTCV